MKYANKHYYELKDIPKPTCKFFLTSLGLYRNGIAYVHSTLLPMSKLTLTPAPTESLVEYNKGRSGTF